MRQKGIDLNHDFYVVVGRQCLTESTRVTKTISLYKLTNILLLFICFKLVLSFSHTKISFFLSENKL